MKLRITSILCFSLLLVSVSTIAQENWETYMATFNGRPGSVMVDLGLLPKIPDSRLTYLLVTGPVANTCNADGLPANEEIPHLEQILEATDDFLEGVTAKVVAGTFTSNCQRVNYYYVHDTMGLRYAIARMYNKSFKDYKYAISIRPDPEWKAYRTFLYPNEETFNWIENNKIITQLLQDKADLSKEKEISFIIYFKTEISRKEFIADMHSRGYEIKELLNAKNSDANFGVRITKNDYVKSTVVDVLSLEVKGEAKKKNGIYNLWSIN